MTGLTLAAALALALALLGTGLLARRGGGVRAVDAGQERWRDEPTPRIGGVAILAGFAVGVALLVAGGDVRDERALGFVAGAVLVAGVGLVDDLRGLRPSHKLVGQILATSLLMITGTTLEIVTIEPLAMALTFFWVIAMTNAMNLLDNMDGLAAGVGLVSLVLLAVHAHLAGLQPVALIAAVLAAALAGFLPFNFRPRGRAAIYMGDGGSQLLGFSLAWLALAASWYEASSAIAAIAIPLLVLAVPILDTTLVSVVRMLEGRPIHQGGRDHTSHRLVIYGLSERRAVLLLVGASAALGASSLLWVEYGRLVPALIGVAFSAAILVQFAFFLVQARQRGAVPPEAPPEPADRRGWLSIETYRLHKRRFVEALIDLGLIVAVYYLAYVLRYDRLPTPLNEQLIADSLPILVAARFSAFLLFGLYRGLWRYAGLRDVGGVLSAVVASEIVTVAALTWAFRFEDYSRSVFVIDAMLCFLVIAGVRLAERGLGEWLEGQRTRRGIPRALIVGAGDAGNALVRELRRRGEHVIAGFVDDDPAKQGRRSQGVPVIGDHRAIEMIIDRHRPEVVYVTIPDAPEERLARIEAACRRGGARYAPVRSHHVASDWAAGLGAGDVAPAAPPAP